MTKVNHFRGDLPDISAVRALLVLCTAEVDEEVITGAVSEKVYEHGQCVFVAALAHCSCPRTLHRWQCGTVTTAFQPVHHSRHPGDRDRSGDQESIPRNVSKVPS